MISVLRIYYKKFTLVKRDNEKEEGKASKV